MNNIILKGNIISTPIFGEIEIVENGYLISTNGIIEGVYKTIEDKYKDYQLIDYGNSLIFQSFSDMHLHAPQYPMLGIGMDLELIDWLNKYTFPQESKYNDLEFAKETYKCLAQNLINLGTTRVAMFSSLHLNSTIILMEELEKAGITGYVGKVNMDRNSIEELSETTQDSIDNTLKWLEAAKKYKNIKPIITPRFTPSCTNELMEFLGKLANDNNLPIQSHLSENIKEINWVSILHPDTKYYYETYKKYKLWNNKTLMAHCVHLNDEERKAIKDAGVFVVHCPLSNINLSSGIANVRKMIDTEIDVVLGSDIAGGDSLSGFDVIDSAIKSSKIKSIIDEEHPKMLTIPEIWYLMTSSANKFFDEKPGFAKGNKLNVIVLDDSKLVNTQNLTPLERFERAIYNRQQDYIKALYSNGNKIK